MGLSGLTMIRSASDYYRILEVKYQKLPNRPGNSPMLPVLLGCRWNSETSVFTCQGDSMRTDRYLPGWYNLLGTLRVQYTEAAACMSDGARFWGARTHLFYKQVSFISRIKPVPPNRPQTACLRDTCQYPKDTGCWGTSEVHRTCYL